ncbi:unnamed protein product [Durusdinium trenchii]|uniref:Fanconi-associated nuclease n=2 Tax=Durusdinium trenchii TaxID=1381693 RepID=A0ABP0LQF7_9DINO
MTCYLGYVADSDEEGTAIDPTRPTPKKRHHDQVIVTPESTAKRGKIESSRKEGPPPKRQTLLAFTDGKVPYLNETPPAPEAVEATVRPSIAEDQHEEPISSTSKLVEGYTLRDLRRVVSAMLPRYGHLLKKEEVQALRAFEALSLSGQQLFARLLCRKWPQWVPAKGLGARYRELGEEEAQIAASELAQPLPQIVRTTSGSWGPLLDQIDSRCAPPNGPWLLDSARETASSLLQRPLCVSSCENFGKLLLSALPVGELRRMGRGLGLAERCGKSQLLEKLCEAAKQQRLLQVSKKPHTDGIEALVSQALRSGRWLCCADSMGRHALMVLGELFRIESCGAAEVSYVLFTTKWPQFSFQEAKPLFTDRDSLDAFVAARSMTGEDFQRYTLEGAEKDACAAEEGLQRALVSVANDFEAAKLRDPFRRRFTAAWRYAEALHHAVTNSPAVGHDQELQAAKIRRLKLLLSSKLCPAKRGRWYAELAKELARSEGPAEALELAARGLAEGMDVAPASAVDLTSEVASSQEVVGTPDERLRVLPRDARWDLARRCRTLARQACQTGKAKNAWKSRLQKTEAARQDASDGKWLSDLASRLIEEEDHATGPVRNLSASKLGLPQIAPDSGKCGRRMFDGFRLEELTVEELAMQHYFTEDGGSFQCGIHCEGAILRDLFGILLFDQMFHCSVEGAFVSAFQDAPLDLGTEAFYPSRSTAIEARLGELAAMSAGDVAADVRQNFRRLQGWRIRGVRWDRYDATGMFLPASSDPPSPNDEKKGESESSADEVTKAATRSRVLCTSSAVEVSSEDRHLAAAAGAMGGRALAAALRLLCEDYNSAGLPDLLLWSWQSTSPRARFVEVKSERDTLARRQRLWLSTLRAAGAEAEVCHVRDGHVEEVFQNKIRQRRKRAASEGSSEGF